MTLPAQDIVERREWLIRKDGYFYRPNCQGYTTRKIEAGRYTKAEAEAEAAVEPWHMSAIHQDEIPDEPAVADLNSEITRLTADNEALTKHVAFLCDALGKERKSVWRDVKLSASTAEAIEAVLEWSADSARVTALEAEIGRLRTALGTIANCGQTAEPDHWRFRQMARETARAALANEEAGG